MSAFDPKRTFHQRHQTKINVASVHSQAHCLPESCSEKRQPTEVAASTISSLVPSVGTKSISKRSWLGFPEAAEHSAGSSMEGPHETARVHCTSWRCGCVAACSAGATAGHGVDRPAQQRTTR